MILKVCVYYCNLPNVEIAQNLKSWLRAAIDTPILLELKKVHPELNFAAKHISGIELREYELLMVTAGKDAQEMGLTPVEWDDVVWSRLNRRQQET